MSVSLKKWSEDSRPRERLLRNGAASLSTAELLAILIGSGTTQKDAVQLMGEVLEYCGNEEMVSHIWVNLLGNAIKFSPQGAPLTVRLRREGGWAVARVRDAGIGMDEATRARVFEKFYQGDGAHAVSGNGLGLSLVKRIVDLCGGTVEVESAPGRGVYVAFELDSGEAEASASVPVEVKEMRLASMPAFLSMSTTTSARFRDSSSLIPAVPVPESA